MMRNNYGTVTFKSKNYTLTEQAEAVNYGADGGVRYEAGAIDAKGNKYTVVWNTTEKWDRACELETLEVQARQAKREYNELSAEDAERLAELREMSLPDVNDESDACDWEHPVKIIEA
jgi:hypothetical protein